MGNKNITPNISRIKAYNSIMCGYFCIGFINFMLKWKSLLKYTNLSFHNDYEKNDKIILKYSQKLKRRKNYIALFVVSIENLKYLLEKILVLSIICNKCKNDNKKLFKEEESIEILKINGLIENI